MKFVQGLFLSFLMLLCAGCSTVSSQYLQVDIHGGRAIMLPSYESRVYMPVQVRINKDSCQIVNLRSLDNVDYTPLNICYKNYALSLSPIYPDKTLKTYAIRFFYIPLWQQGFTYRNISSVGSPYLYKLIVKVKQTNIVVAPSLQPNRQKIVVSKNKANSSKHLQRNRHKKHTKGVS